MFVQIIEGTVHDVEALLQQTERWERDVRPGADGYLGSTSGVADGGRMVSVVRFESEAAARRNSARPEQDAWWRETSNLFGSDVSFTDATEIYLAGKGGSDDAGFVQVIRGRAKDPERLKALDNQLNEIVIQNRPEFMGGLVAWRGADFTYTAYFTSEEDARAGERRVEGLSEEQRTMLEEWMSLMEDVRYLDLRDPQFSS
jgi:hypothetical protein